MKRWILVAVFGLLGLCGSAVAAPMKEGLDAKALKFFYRNNLGGQLTVKTFTLKYRDPKNMDQEDPGSIWPKWIPFRSWLLEASSSNEVERHIPTKIEAEMHGNNMGRSIMVNYFYLGEDGTEYEKGTTSFFDSKPGIWTGRLDLSSNYKSKIKAIRIDLEPTPAFASQLGKLKEGKPVELKLDVF